MDTKSCTGCGETKPLGEFYKDRGRPTPQCKECVLKDRKAKQPQANATRRKRHQQRVDEGDYVTPEFKQCNGKCKRILPIAEFHNCRGTADGKQAKCKQCVSDYQKANRDKTRDNQRAYRKRGGEALKREERSRSLFNKYGITADEFDNMLALQGGVCAVNGCSDVGNSNWHLDHDHNCCPTTPTCGRCTRAIVCPKCNKGLGQFGDDPAKLIAAANYLIAHSAKETTP